MASASCQVLRSKKSSKTLCGCVGDAKDDVGDGGNGGVYVYCENVASHPCLTTDPSVVNLTIIVRVLPRTVVLPDKLPPSVRISVLLEQSGSSEPKVQS